MAEPAESSESGESGDDVEKAAGRTLLMKFHLFLIVVGGTSIGGESEPVSIRLKLENGDFSVPLLGEEDVMSPSNPRNRLDGGCTSFRMIKSRLPGAGRHGPVDGGSLPWVSADSLKYR